MLTLSIVTVNYHSEVLLQRLLNSAQTLQRPPPTEWIIVDHTPNDPDLAKRLIPPPGVSRFSILPYPQNQGFSDGCNLGARNSTGQILFFLNPDCRFEGGSLHPLLKRFEADAVLAALGPRMLNSRGELEFSFDRFPGIFGEALLKAKKYFSPRWPRVQRAVYRGFDRFHWVDWVTGGALLARREAFFQVGGFDDGFFLYFEDTDLCKRLHQAGFKVGFDPAFCLIHDHGQGGSSRMSRGKPSAIYRQSQIRYYGKHKSPLSRAALHAYLRLTGRHPSF